MTNNLHETTDAAIWAAEFCKRFPSALCQVPGREGVTDGDDFEGIMIGWFANAIMAGVESEARKAVDPATIREKALREAGKAALETYDKENPFRTADYHGDGCDCLRCRMGVLRALIDKE